MGIGFHDPNDFVHMIRQHLPVMDVIPDDPIGSSDFVLAKTRLEIDAIGWIGDDQIDGVGR